MVKQRSPDRNFGVIELLVVAVIVGILMQLLIPLHLRQRTRGWEAAAQSDVRNGALVQSSYFIEHDRYTTNIAELTDQGFKASGQIDLWISGIADAGSIVMEAQHCRGGDRFRWMSDEARVERLERADREC